ncbi:MAG: cupredoxin domain-containing protein [Rhodanobacteraceae bacterium]
MLLGLVSIATLGAYTFPAAASPVHELSKSQQVVSVTQGGQATASIVLETRAVAVKETGPKATVAKFGEVYGFSPTLFVVRENQPTRIRFWNLQPDDAHNFELLSPHANKLIFLALPPLSDKSYIFNFHQPGLYTFKCTIHRPEMNGQILGRIQLIDATHCR